MFSQGRRAGFSPGTSAHNPSALSEWAKETERQRRERRREREKHSQTGRTYLLCEKYHGVSDESDDIWLKETNKTKQKRQREREKWWNLKYRQTKIYSVWKRSKVLWLRTHHHHCKSVHLYHTVSLHAKVCLAAVITCILERRWIAA